MSSAFVKETEEQWLHEISPTLTALIVYLTRQNNGVRVYEKKHYKAPRSNVEVFEMSNGLTYSKKDDRWVIV